MRNVVLTSLVVFFCPSIATAQDTVRFIDRAGRSERPVQETKGKVEGESLAGVKIGGRTIRAGDIVDVEYETPGGLRLDLGEARQLEDGRKIDEAIRKYRGLAASPSASNT